MQSNDTTFTTRYVDGAWDVIRVSDGAVMQTYDTPALAAEHAARLSTRAAIELAAELDEQAADLALTRAVFDAQGIRLAAEDAAPVGQCAACRGACAASDLYCSDACCDALSVAQLVEESEEGWRVAPSYPLAVRCSAPGVRVVPDALPDTARLVWRWQGTADELRAEIERRRAAYWERSERLREAINAA